MVDTNRDDPSTMLYHDPAVPSGSSHNHTMITPAGQQRTRSPFNVPDAVLRLPPSRSSLKDARKARPEVWLSSPTAAEESTGPGTVREAGVDMVLDVERDENMKAVPDELVHKNHPSTKKRASPDTDTARALSSPGSERQSKRTKLETFRSLGHTQEHSEYREPLRDPDSATARRSKGHKRAASTKPTSSPIKPTPSIFPVRAKSVPLAGEGGSEIPAMDLTSLPPSPRRSPNKSLVEIRRAPPLPPTDNDRMDVDSTPALLHFTNSTQFENSQPAFQCTVNFATPRRPATPSRSGLPATSPLSPLTPLPGSPSGEYRPETCSVLAKASAKLKGLSGRADLDTNTPSRTTAELSTADIHHTALRVSPSPPADSAPSSATFQPSLIWPRSPSTSTELMPPLAAFGKESDATIDASMNPGVYTTFKNSDSARVASMDVSNLSSVPGSRSTLNAALLPRRGIVKAMNRKPPAVPRGQRRVTRSVSMKEPKLTGTQSNIEDTAEDSIAEACIATQTTGISPQMAPVAPQSTVSPTKSTITETSKLKTPLTGQRSTSLSIPPRDSKLRQTSLNMYMKSKPAVGGTIAADSPIASTSTSIASTSKVALSPSPSKIPRPTSPLKRTLTIPFGNSKSSQASHDPSDDGGTSRNPGRSLRNLSHALEKLVVPPPSRPNTSLGFVRANGVGEDTGTPENAKGKGKAKDDTSLPAAVKGSRATFARPTASSLKRAATMTGFGLNGVRGRGGAVVGGSGRGPGKTGIFGRAGDRASRKTNLPVVMGSPVKGSGGADDSDRDILVSKSRLHGTGEEDTFISRDTEPGSGHPDMTMQCGLVGGGSGQKHLPQTAATANINIQISTSADKGKQRALPPSTLNPASAALQALSQSLSSLPQTPTPPKPRVPGIRTGLRSSSGAAGKGSPALDASGAGAGSAGSSEVHSAGSAGPSNGVVNGSGGGKKGSLKILKRCSIFVDVRTEQGDDAGSVFVDMLKGLGARIMGRLGQSCTHIIYKNGHPNTLTRYRLLNDPKPAVVGIAWVVECAEQRTRLNEERFKVDVDLINVAGGNANKRRRTMLPKHLIPSSPGPTHETPMHASSEGDDSEGVSGGVDGSPSQDPDTSVRSRDEDDLPPLERARRRRSVLPGGQTRLVLNP